MLAYLTRVTKRGVMTVTIMRELKFLKECRRRTAMRMTEAAMPQGDGGKQCMRRGRGCTVDRVQVTRAIEPSDLHPGAKILHRQPKRTKFNRNLVIDSKASNRNEIFDSVWGDEDIVKREGMGGRGNGVVASVRDCKR